MNGGVLYKSGYKGVVEGGGGASEVCSEGTTFSREVITGNQCDFRTLMRRCAASRAPPPLLTISRPPRRPLMAELLLVLLHVITHASVSKEGCLFTQDVRKHFPTN